MISTKKNKAVIRFRQSLFWDVNPGKVDPKKHAKYIIERMLDFGNDKELKWMFSYYSPGMIRKILFSSRVIDKKSKSLWTLLYT